MAFQLRRGLNTDRLNIKLAQGELVYTTDTKKLFVGDGITVGGTEVSLNDSDINATVTGGQSPAILAIVTKEFVDNLGINAVKLDGYSRDYYRNYNNLTNTPSILDSSNVQSLSRDSSFVSSVVDSSYVNNLVNTSYIQSKIDQLFIDTFDTHDSGAVQNMIDIAVAANDTVDSAAIVAQIINTVTQSFIDTFNTHDSIAVGNNIDSKVDQTFVRNFIDQSFIQAFINQAFIDTFDTHDEVATLTQINSTIDGAYVRNSIDQAFIDTFDTHDSNIVASQIYTTVTQSFIDNFDTHDSAAVQAQIDAIPGLSGDAVTLGGNDSSYYLNYNNFSNTPNLLDSSEALNLINTSYVQGKIDQTFINTFDTHDSAIVDAQINAELATRTFYDSAAVQAQIDSAVTQSFIDQFDTHDSAAVDAQINAELATRTFYDSGAVQNQIDSAVTQSFINTFDTHDSVAITGQITSTVNTSYVQGKIDQTFIDGFDTHDSVAIQNMINTTIAATDTHDSSAVLGQINATVDQTFVRNFVDQSFIDTFDTHDSVAIQNQITSTVNQAFIDTFDTHDEVAVQAQIDSAVTQSFINTFDTHDSAAVDAQIDAKLGTNVTVGGNLSVTGYIDGPEVFTIDPAAVGDATGKVVILGDLQVDGVQTTINSTEVSISDKNIVLADSATSAAEANGAGITVNGASATLQYVSTGDKWEFNKDVNVSGDISVSGTVDGRDVATDGTKLDGIETGATADQTGSQIKALYEGEANAFTDAQFTKLAGIETGATADQTGAEIKALYEAEANAFTDAQFTKLAGIEASATADQTQAEINALGITATGLSGNPDITVGNTTTNNIEVGTIDFAAIAESKSETATDVFVYDTSKDTDGGAWRHRTQNTSWYNETLNTSTRGSRKEFPAVAVIVVEAAGPVVTIYDGDDPSLPMWMVANVRGQDTTNYGFTALGGQSGFLDSTAALNGKLCFGGSGTYQTQGLLVWDFLADTFGNYTNASVYSGITAGTLADRNTIQLITQSLPLIVNTFVNDVAMTVLPNAPIDAATGLPVPTIAVATDGGVSVIKDDGTVVNPPPYVAKNSKSIDIGKNGDLFNDGVFATTWSDSYTPYDDGNWSSGQLFSYVSNYPTTRFGSSTNQSNIIVTPYGFAGEGMIPDNASPILYQMMLDPSDVRDGSAVAYTTSTYNTGWMNGDIKGAFLSDTDDTDLVGSGDLVTNGTFDTDTTGWIGSDATLSISSGELVITSDVAGSCNASTSITTVIGETYVISVDHKIGSVNQDLLVGTAAGNGSNYNGPTIVTNQTETVPFVATSTTTYITIRVFSSAIGQYSGVDNISVKLADADRSVNNNGLIVNGTVTRTPVATGADLVAYSGFSSSNYLEQPYNTDFNFGTGDFSIMGWIKKTEDGATKDILRRRGASSSSNFSLHTTGNILRYQIGGSAVIDGSIVVPINSWVFVSAVRRAGIAELYVNAELDVSDSRTNDIVGDSTASLRVGSSSYNSPFSGSISLLRISATAPSAAQIEKIYNDEKFLFQENAKATLYGSSDVVTALAHDEDTGLLHVGTSAGRSEFQGLRRINNTTTGVTTAISVSDNLVVEQ